MSAHREVRHHPDTGHVAVRFDGHIHGSGAHWLYLHTDEHGDVIATPMTDAEVANWPRLTPDGDSVGGADGGDG